MLFFCPVRPVWFVLTCFSSPLFLLTEVRGSVVRLCLMFEFCSTGIWSANKYLLKRGCYFPVRQSTSLPVAASILQSYEKRSILLGWIVFFFHFILRYVLPRMKDFLIQFHLPVLNDLQSVLLLVLRSMSFL